MYIPKEGQGRAATHLRLLHEKVQKGKSKRKRPIYLSIRIMNQWNSLVNYFIFIFIFHVPVRACVRVLYPSFLFLISRSHKKSLEECSGILRGASYFSKGCTLRKGSLVGSLLPSQLLETKKPRKKAKKQLGLRGVRWLKYNVTYSTVLPPYKRHIYIARGYGGGDFLYRDPSLPPTFFWF